MSKWDGESTKDEYESWYGCSSKGVDSGVDEQVQCSILKGLDM